MVKKVDKTKRPKQNEVMQKSNFFDDESMQEVDDVVNSGWEVPEPVQFTPAQESRVEVVPPPAEPKKKGRPKKGTVLDLNIGINVFLDKPLHKKLQFTKAETDIGIKDLIYMATDYVMNELFDNGVPTREGERVIREFKEKMFGADD